MQYMNVRESMAALSNIFLWFVWVFFIFRLRKLVGQNLLNTRLDHMFNLSKRKKKNFGERILE